MVCYVGGFGFGFTIWLLRLFLGLRATCVGLGLDYGLGELEFEVFEGSGGRNLGSGRVIF